jgi:hypothetical protein
LLELVPWCYIFREWQLPQNSSYSQASIWAIAYKREYSIICNELPRSRAARYQKEFLLTPMQSIEEFF